MKKLSPKQKRIASMAKPFNKITGADFKLLKKKKKKIMAKDACYHKVKRKYKVFPSAYASGAIAKCRKVGAKNWGNGSKKK